MTHAWFTGLHCNGHDQMRQVNFTHLSPDEQGAVGNSFKNCTRNEIFEALIGDKRELTRENEKNTWCKMKLTTDSEKLARRQRRRNKKSRQNRGKNYKPTTNLSLLNWRCLSDSAVGCRSWFRWCLWNNRRSGRQIHECSQSVRIRLDRSNHDGLQRRKEE